MADRILKILHRWATGNKKRKQRLIRVYLFIGRYIPALRARGDRIIIESKHADEQPEPVSGADDGVSAYDVPVPCKSPLVSVIVPNYNHAPYLRERLDSIYGQTYRHIEVILLDDASTDNSREILNAYREQHPENTRTVFNEVNSGRVNLQWNKGLELAKGQYIWIAESDDWCEPDFLEKLVPELQRQSVMIAFARSVFMQKGRKIWSTEEYLRDTGLDWTASFRMTAYRAVQRGFARKNFIPNVSSAVFRNIGMIPDEVMQIWEHIKLCGDWIFYLWLIKGGAFSYVSDATNYYRIHPASTSLNVQATKEYYIETETVSQYIARNYRVDEKVFHKVLEDLKNHYEMHHTDENSDQVEQWYRIPVIRKEMAKRFPHVMICNFAMQSGGGEVFPIHLATALRRKGVVVTFVDVRMDQYEQKVRDMLEPSVPLIELAAPVVLDKVCDAFGAEVIHSHNAVIDKLIAQYVMQKGSNKTDAAEGEEHEERNSLKHVITLHGMYETIDSGNQQELLSLVTKSASCFAYIADKNLQPFRDKGFAGQCHFVKVHNGLLFAVPQPANRAELGIPQEAFAFCLVSRALFAKGWLEAAAAVKLANEQSEREIHLILVGEGEAYEKIRKDDSPFIHAVGMQQNPKRYFAASDMGLLPSYFQGESVPLVVIESLMCGRPVLATDVGQIREMLTTPQEELAGCLLPLQKGKVDVKALADKMAEIAQDAENYRKMKQCTDTAAAPFDIMNVVEEYREIYKEVVGR